MITKSLTSSSETLSEIKNRDEVGLGVEGGEEKQEGNTERE